MRNPVRAVVAATLIAGPTALAFFSGGFFERPRLIAAIAVWVIAGVSALVSPRPLPRSTPGRLAIAGLALLAGLTALSTEWAPIGQRALEDTQRLVLYLGAFVAGAALLRGPLARRWLEPAMALGTVVVTFYALSERLLPGAITFEHSKSGEGRLEQPLTYWNAMGCLSAIGLVLCLRIAGDARQLRPVRIAAGIAGAPLGLGVYLSFSRGALFALAAGLAALLLLTPSLRGQARAATTLVAGGAVAALVASFLPTVSSLPRGQMGDETEGLVMLGSLLVIAAAAGVATALAPVQTAAAPRRVSRTRPALAVAAVVLVIAAGLATAASLEKGPQARSAGDPTSASRFGSADTTRYAFWGVALDAFGRDPIAGVGSGGFSVQWRRQPDRTEDAVDAHSLYIETLAELGIAGALLLVLFLGSIATAGARLYVRDPAAAAGPAAALLVWVVHAGLDWDWEMPAVTGIALLLAAAIVARDDERSQPADPLRSA